MKTEDILSKVKATATAAGHKANQVVESTKLNYRLYELRGEANELYRQIGMFMYAAHTGERKSQEELDDLLATLDLKNAELDAVREKKLANKKMKSCKSCGKASAEDDTFCPSCGAPFEGAEAAGEAEAGAEAGEGEQLG